MLPVLFYRCLLVDSRLHYHFAEFAVNSYTLVVLFDSISRTDFQNWFEKTGNAFDGLELSYIFTIAKAKVKELLQANGNFERKK